MNPISFLLISTVVGIGVYTVNEYRKHVKLLKRYNKIIDDIFLITCHPETNESPYLPRFKGEKKIIILFVPYDKIFDEQARQIALLEQSKNPFYMSDARIAELQLQGKKILTPDEAVEVKLLIFQSGSRRCETWEEFTEYCEQEIINDVQPHHEKMQKKNGDWYDVNYHGKRPILTVDS